MSIWSILNLKILSHNNACASTCWHATMKAKEQWRSIVTTWNCLRKWWHICKYMRNYLHIPDFISTFASFSPGSPWSDSNYQVFFIYPSEYFYANNKATIQVIIAKSQKFNISRRYCSQSFGLCLKKSTLEIWLISMSTPIALSQFLGNLSASDYLPPALWREGLNCHTKQVIGQLQHNVHDTFSAHLRWILRHSTAPAILHGVPYRPLDSPLYIEKKWWELRLFFE